MSRRVISTRSLRADLVIAAVVPLLMFAAAATGTIYWMSETHRERRVHSKLETVSAFLAESSELGFLTESPDNFRRSLQSALAAGDIVHISFYNPQGELILADGEVELPALEPHELAPERLGYRVLEGALYELVTAVDYPEADQEAELLSFLGNRDTPARAEGARPDGIVRVVMTRERVTAEYIELLSSSGAGLALVLALGIGLAVGLAHAPLQAIGRLVAAARHIGRGDFEHRVPDVGTGEIAQLAAAFNEMGDRLCEAHGEIGQQQQLLEQRVTERTVELESARIEAETASRAKSQFLANMSHEIRTPMTAILGYTELLMDRESDGGEQSELLAIVKRNGAHLLEIINDVLDLSKIEAGRLEIEELPMNPAQLVADIASLMRVRADQKGIRLGVEFIGELPSEVLSDPTRVRQAVMNLVGNAIKFTERGSVCIRVSYSSAEQQTSVEVIDTGSGIPSDALPSLFMQFEQADNSTSRRFGGTGLGLAIVKRIGLLLAGGCSVRSEEGHGSTFRFFFSSPPAPGARLVAPGHEAELAPREQGTATLQRLLPNGTRLLLAEDGLDNQRLISAFLRRAGAEVELAQNGREAVEMVQNGDFDLVLMDMAMPEMDGYEATRALRDLGYDLPIVAVTAHALAGERTRCLEAGCDEYVKKPIARNELIAHVSRLLKRRASSPE